MALFESKALTIYTARNFLGQVESLSHVFFEKGLTNLRRVKEKNQKTIRTDLKNFVSLVSS